VAAILLVLIIYMVWRATHRITSGIATGRSVPVAEGCRYPSRELVTDTLPGMVEAQLPGDNRG
jgi:fumarate reductase subunit D